MKKLIFLFAAFVSALTFTACSSDDDNNSIPQPEPEPDTTSQNYTATIELKATAGEDLLKYADVRLVYYLNDEDSISTPITSLDTVRVVRENLPYTDNELKLDAYIRTTAKTPFPAFDENTTYYFKKDLDVKISITNGSLTKVLENDKLKPWYILDFDVPGNELPDYFSEAFLEYHFKKAKNGSSTSESFAN